MAANFDITVERVGGGVVRVEVLGSDRHGERVAHLHAEMSLADLALIGRLVGEAAEDAARSWPGVTVPGRPPVSTMEARRQTHPNAYRRWADDDDALLVERIGQGATVPELVAEFGRNRGAIVSRAARLGHPLVAPVARSGADRGRSS